MDSYLPPGVVSPPFAEPAPCPEFAAPGFSGAGFPGPLSATCCGPAVPRQSLFPGACPGVPGSAWSGAGMARPGMFSSDTGFLSAFPCAAVSAVASPPARLRGPSGRPGGPAAGGQMPVGVAWACSRLPQSGSPATPPSSGSSPLPWGVPAESEPEMAAGTDSGVCSAGTATPRCPGVGAAVAPWVIAQSGDQSASKCCTDAALLPGALPAVAATPPIPSPIPAITASPTTVGR